MLRLVARLAYRLKLPFARIRIPYAEGEVWPVAQVLDVVHYRRAAVPVPLLSAYPALAMIQPYHFGAHRPPLRPPVKRLLASLLNKLAELGEAAIAYRRHQLPAQTATPAGRICRTARGILPISFAARTPPPGSLRSSAGTACGGCQSCPRRASKSSGDAGRRKPTPPMCYNLMLAS